MLIQTDSPPEITSPCFQIPEVSSKRIVRSAFRNQELILDKAISDVLEKADKLDVATAVIRVLESNIAKVNQSSEH
jgi:hypothetical protein